MRRYDDDVRAKALAAFEAGETYEKIEAEFGPSRRSVRTWATEAGLKNRSHRSSCNDASIKKAAVDRYLGGESSSNVAFVFSVDKATIVRWVGEAKRARRVAAPPRKSTQAEVAAMVAQTGSIRGAAYALSISKNTAKRRLRGD